MHSMRKLGTPLLDAGGSSLIGPVFTAEGAIQTDLGERQPFDGRVDA